MADISIRWFDSLVSTSSAISGDRDSLCDLSVYAALFQTAGKGQRGNSWESKKGENLTFSILFRPSDLRSREQFSISQAAALGVVDYLKGKGLEASVKWPNDIYVGDRKICGILIENSLAGDNLSVSIAGIGLNVNQTVFESDAPNPTSLSLETGKHYNIQKELPEVLDKIAGIYLSITRGERCHYLRTSLDGRYLENLYRRGEWHFFEEMPSQKRVRARILGTDDSDCLLTEHEDGSIHRYAFKEIRYVL